MVLALVPLAYAAPNPDPSHPLAYGLGLGYAAAPVAIAKAPGERQQSNIAAIFNGN